MPPTAAPARRAQVTGKPGIVLVTSGPGATNTITPMQDALMDGTPMVVFAGQVPPPRAQTCASANRNQVLNEIKCTKC